MPARQAAVRAEDRLRRAPAHEFSWLKVFLSTFAAASVLLLAILYPAHGPGAGLRNAKRLKYTDQRHARRLGLTSSSPPPPPDSVCPINVDPETRQFIDCKGRTRLFRGLNVVWKEPPWYPPSDRFDPVRSFSDEDVDILADDLNLNVIRLSISWAGVEPVRGRYDMKYIEKMKRIVRSCARKDIMVLLEFHQDLLAPQFCGHGVPTWFVDRAWLSPWLRFPFPLNLPYWSGEPTSIPSKEQCNRTTWYLRYLTYAVGDAFQRLYSNKYGLRDSFSEYWGKVAQEFKEEPNILGYEIINEPWLGNHVKNPLLLIPGQAGRTNLFPFYHHVSKKIESIDPHHLIFFSDPTLDARSGIPLNPTQNSSHSVLAYHYYKPPQRMDVRSFMKIKAEDSKRLGTGSMMTEFEFWHGDGSKEGEKLDALRAADEYLQSWIGWSYKSFSQGPNTWDGSLFDDSTSQRRPYMEQLLSRTFAPIVGGRVLNMTFKDDERKFELIYTPSCADETTETVIKVQPRIHYPDGFEVHRLHGVTEGQDSEEWDEASIEMADDHTLVYRTGRNDCGREVHLRVIPRG